MNTILSKNINTILYNHQVPNDFSKFIQDFLIIELGDDKEHKFYTYPIYEVINVVAEYIKFIILNDSRGNYNIKRGFAYEENIIDSKADYCRYLKFIFDKMKINLDYSKIEKQIGKRRLVQGDARYANLIYEFLQDDILNELKRLHENGLVELSSDYMHLTKYDELVKSQGFKNDGVSEYENIPEEYKDVYYCMKELKEMQCVKHIDKNDSNGLIEHRHNLNLYYDLWYTTKYARAQNRGASNDELKEIEMEYKKHCVNNGVRDIKPLQEKLQHFVKNDNDYERGN